MATKKKTENEPVEIDEFSTTMFHHMGYNPVPRVLAETYIGFKRDHDIVRPSRLTEEGYATVVALAKLKDPVQFAPKPAPKPAPKESASDEEVDASDPFKE